MGLFKSNEKIIAEEIMKVFDGGVFHKNEVKYEKYSLSIKIDASGLEKHNGTVMSKTVYTVTHPLFDEPILEPGVGIGKNTDEALHNSAQSFICVVAASVFAALGCTDGFQVKSSATGREIVFRKSCISPVMRTGNADDKTILWETINDIIPEYLGSKNAYWIKLFAAVSNNEPIFEVRVNNTEYSDISRVLAERTGNVFVGEAYSSQKEFILLTREEPEECRFTAEQVKEYSAKAIDIFISSFDADSAVDNIEKMCGDKVLAYELGSFLPEIYTKTILNIEEPDEVCICRGDKETAVKRSVIRDYGYIESAVKDYIYRIRPGEKENLQIMAGSARLNAVHKSLMQGAKLENIEFSKIYYNVPDYYEIR